MWTWTLIAILVLKCRVACVSDHALMLHSSLLLNANGIYSHGLTVEDIKYPGFVSVKSRLFKCSFQSTCKCLPILLYGIEVCILSKSDIHLTCSQRSHMKLFKPCNKDKLLLIIVSSILVLRCQARFVTIAKFISKCRCCENDFC